MVLEKAVDRLLSYQTGALACGARFTWHCWSRQAGKSFAMSARRLLRGLERGRNQLILSAGMRQSREVMEKVRGHCDRLALECRVERVAFFRDASIKMLEARLPGGARILALPANPMTARGFTGDVFLDEFAMHRDDASIWAALFPALLRCAGELDIASTPRGRQNLFYRLSHNEQFVRDTVTLQAAIDAGLATDPAILRGAMEDEELWRQEFCCEFVDESTAFMTYELIRSCQDVRLQTIVDWAALRQREREAYVGVDVGRVRDVTVAWIWERREGGPAGKAAGDDMPPEATFTTRGVAVLASAPFAQQEAFIANLMRQPAVRRCCVDATGLGMHLAERLAARFGEDRVEAVTFTNAIKGELAGALRVLAERGCVWIPPEEDIMRDWHSLTRTVTSSGHIRLDANRSGGGHADRFWAAALGIHAAGNGGSGGPPGLMTSGRLQFVKGLSRIQRDIRHTRNCVQFNDGG